MIDCVVQVSNYTHRAHQVVLAAESIYFEALFKGKFKENQTKTVDLTNSVGTKTFSMVLRFIYTREIDLSKENLVPVARASDYLQIASLSKECSEHAQEKLPIHHCLEVLEATRGMNLLWLDKVLGMRCATSYMEIEQSLLSSSHEVLIQVIDSLAAQSSATTTAKEYARYSAQACGMGSKHSNPDWPRVHSLVTRWFKQDTARRCDTIAEVLSHVRI